MVYLHNKGKLEEIDEGDGKLRQRKNSIETAILNPKSPKSVYSTPKYSN